MKDSFLTVLKLCFTVLVLSIVTSGTYAKEMAYIMSPHQSPDALDAEVKRIIEVLVGLEPNDKAAVIDGYSLEDLGLFLVPEGSRYASPRARIAKNKDVIARMLQFAEDGQLPQPDSMPSVNGIRLPDLLLEAAANKGSGALDVIILGSPLYADPRETSFAMTGGRYPSDSHLFKSRAETPYGTAGLSERLAGIRVHMVFDRDQVIQSAQHAYYLERWWTLYIESMGGELVSFTGNFNAAINKVKSGASGVAHGFEAQDSDKLEMIPLRPPEIIESIQDRTINTNPVARIENLNTSNLDIGISWDQEGTDLDLFVRPWQGAEVLYYANAHSDEGIFFKDYQTSPEAGGNYETVALNVPLDVRSVQIAVNYYSGRFAEDVQGEIRLSFDGSTYAQPFTIQPRPGGNSLTVEEVFTQGLSPYRGKLVFDTLDLLGLRPL